MVAASSGSGPGWLPAAPGVWRLLLPLSLHTCNSSSSSSSSFLIYSTHYHSTITVNIGSLPTSTMYVEQCHCTIPLSLECTLLTWVAMGTIRQGDETLPFCLAIHKLTLHREKDGERGQANATRTETAIEEGSEAHSDADSNLVLHSTGCEVDPMAMELAHLELPLIASPTGEHQHPTALGGQVNVIASVLPTYM